MNMSEERVYQVTMFVWDSLDELVNAGMLSVANEKYKVTDKLKKEVDKLRDAGLEPSQREINYVMKSMFDAGIISMTGTKS